MPVAAGREGLVVTSPSDPRFDPNPNAGDVFRAKTNARSATTTIRPTRSRSCFPRRCRPEERAGPTLAESWSGIRPTHHLLRWTRIRGFSACPKCWPPVHNKRQTSSSWGCRGGPPDSGCFCDGEANRLPGRLTGREPPLAGPERGIPAWGYAEIEALKRARWDYIT